MPNTNVNAVRVANDKIRPLADRMGQLYNAFKMAQAEYTAESWATLFPNDAEVIVDGSATDGRTPITNADVVYFMNSVVGPIITDMEATSFAKRNNVLKIAPNPERV